jgi:plasmid stabilization system protein ParE
LRGDHLAQIGAHDIEAIHEFIAQDNPEAAARVRRAIRIAIDRPARHPNLGRAGRVEGTRELIVSNAPYIVAYRVTEGQVRILAILHTSRRWPRRF